MLKSNIQLIPVTPDSLRVTVACDFHVLPEG